MAVANLPQISAALVAAGRSGDTPAVIVENASLPQQRVFTTTLAELAEVAEAHQVVPPAVVIIGDVARR
jgi:siroheme synthase